MKPRSLPDLTPKQVVDLQDALLANADVLLTSALAVLDLGHVGLARSLAILGMEESGKAIAVHERRVQMGHEVDGELFRCEALDSLWASHDAKLKVVHSFLVEERYWFGVEPSDPAVNAAYLGAIKGWARRQNHIKQRGFYVELSRNGSVLTPADVADNEALREVIQHVHQIGWQLRLGEHIEGSSQDEKERGHEPLSPETLTWLEREEFDELRTSLMQGIPGQPLRNAAYRFNPPDADRSPFRNLGKPGYEAETRELMLLAERLDKEQAERGESD